MGMKVEHMAHRSNLYVRVRVCARTCVCVGVCVWVRARIYLSLWHSLQHFTLSFAQPLEVCGGEVLSQARFEDISLG